MNCIEGVSYRFCKFKRFLCNNNANSNENNQKEPCFSGPFLGSLDLGLDSLHDVAEDVADRRAKQGENNNHDNGD